jgi:hypothetical protein
MIIQIDENNNVISLITVGGLPEGDPSYIRLNKYDVPTEILEHITDYKYIDGEFIHQDNPDVKYIDSVRNSKISLISIACKQVIETGIDFNGDHYSLTAEDQMNLTNLSMMAQTLPMVPYHADGQLCRMYSAEEITALATNAIRWITFHTTYHNFLKSYIKSITDLQTLIETHYGSMLPDTYTEQLTQILGDGVDFTKFLVDVPDTMNYDRLTGKIDIDKMTWEEDMNQPEPIPEPDPEDIEGGEDFEETSENDTMSDIEDESDDTDDSP